MKKNIISFINYLKDKDYSQNTVLSYEKDLDLFCEYAKNCDVAKVDYSFIRSYLQFLHNQNYTAKTISRHISSLKSFFKYLTKMDIIKENPCLLVTNPKIEKNCPIILTIKI